MKKLMCMLFVFLFASLAVGQTTDQVTVLKTDAGYVYTAVDAMSDVPLAGIVLTNEDSILQLLAVKRAPKYYMVRYAERGILTAVDCPGQVRINKGDATSVTFKSRGMTQGAQVLETAVKVELFAPIERFALKIQGGVRPTSKVYEIPEDLRTALQNIVAYWN
jgi:hypothetical protein